MILLSTNNTTTKEPATLNEFKRDLQRLLERTALPSEGVLTTKNAWTTADLIYNRNVQYLDSNEHGVLRASMPTVELEHSECIHIDMMKDGRYLHIVEIVFPGLDISDVAEICKILTIAIRNALHVR